MPPEPASAFAGEEIPAQTHRLDHRLGAARLLQLAAQAADARVDRAVEPVVVDAAHDAQDLVPRDDVALARSEEPEDVDVAGGELYAVPVERGGALGGVDRQAPGRELRVAGLGRRGPRAAEQRLDARQQHAWLDRLHH